MCCDKDTLSCYLDELHSLDEDHVEKHGTLCVGEVRAQGPTSSAAGDSRASLHVLYPMQIRVVPHSAAVHVAGGFLGTRCHRMLPLQTVDADVGEHGNQFDSLGHRPADKVRTVS